MSFSKRPLEFYTFSPEQGLSKEEWIQVLQREYCPYIGKRCTKIRKSEPDTTIGTCTVGFKGEAVIICPNRFLQRRQIFLDTIHLLEQHQPGNQLHVVPEIEVPGGSIDYFVASVHRGDIHDYIAVEIQAMDSTGTVWPARQEFVKDYLDLPVSSKEIVGAKSYGMNWKMTAKTILVQMHHKVETLELLGKKMVLVLEDSLYSYLKREFVTESLQSADLADSAHFHVYNMRQGEDGSFSIELESRYSTTTLGIEEMLGLRHSAQVSEEHLVNKLRSKISDRTLLAI